MELYGMHDRCHNLITFKLVDKEFYVNVSLLDHPLLNDFRCKQGYTLSRHLYISRVGSDNSPPPAAIMTHTWS